jgi:glycerate 2-kinase
MMIKNRDDLLSAVSGDAFRSRKVVLDALEVALRSVDPGELVRRHMRLDDADGGVLFVDDFRYELDGFRRIFVIGGGKASAAMAEAVVDILGDRVDGGVVNVLPETVSRFRTGRIVLNEASHPVPDERGVFGVEKMLRLVNGVSDRDLVICLISGGGSSLLPLPVQGVGEFAEFNSGSFEMWGSY